ncbi:MAG: pyridoxal phosphate-dependent aminotransferase [Gammaproteobacteria bacterium]
MTIPFTSLVRELPAATPFVGPEALERERGARFKARIGANESAFGISPRAVEAMREAVARGSWYADPESYDLRSALAARHGVDIEEICVDAGIDSLLGLTVRMLVSAGAPVVTSLGAYPTFNYHVAGFGGNLLTVPYKDDHEDPDALLAMTRKHDAPLVYLANPDNPMGTWHDAEQVQAFVDDVPDGTVLALDEAYIEFASDSVAPPVDTRNPRVMRLRTFSKAYGMAGLRIGYAIAHKDLITGLNKIRNHFGINRVAQIGALVSLGDEAFLESVSHAVEAGRQRIYAFARSHGLDALPSFTNFVAVDIGSPERGAAMLKALGEKDVFMRMPGVAPLNRCIRVGIGTLDENALFEEAFTASLAELPRDGG